MNVQLFFLPSENKYYFPPHTHFKLLVTAKGCPIFELLPKSSMSNFFGSSSFPDSPFRYSKSKGEILSHL